MRIAFINALIELARENENIFLLVGDLGYGLVEPYAREFPQRFINTGIAEQNMIGVATGLALSGKTVFVYSIANFPIMRCLEQIRNDVCFHNADVKIVSAGGGLTYGALGASHHLTEDIAVMAAMPDMTVVVPCDPIEAGLATRAVAGQPSPCYLRLGRTNDPQVHKNPPDFEIGKAIKVREGKDVTLIATGGILVNVVQAAEILAGEGIEARVLSMHTIKPLDKDAVLLAASDTKAIVTVEEHNRIGGLGSAVAGVLCEAQKLAVAFLRLALPNEFCISVGTQEYLRGLYGLSGEGIAESVKLLVRGEL